jgi:hypothetical protein
MTMAGAMDNLSSTPMVAALFRRDVISAVIAFFDQLFRQPHFLAQLATWWSCILLVTFVVFGLSARHNRWRGLKYPRSEWVVARRANGYSDPES